MTGEHLVADAAAAIDQTFREAMRAAARRGGPDLRERHPPGFGMILVDFRTVLARPDGYVTAANYAEVVRYRDPDAAEQDLVAASDRGSIERDGAAGFRATAAGHAFLEDLYAVQDAVLTDIWSGQPLGDLAAILGDLVSASAARAVIPGTFAAMEPAFEPDGIGAAVLVLNRLSALRYFRSDAHASAWREAGLSAAEMVALQEAGGPLRDAIEARTNEIVAPLFASVPASFVADLHAIRASVSAATTS